MLNEELQLHMVSKIISVKEEYYVYSEDIAFDTSTISFVVFTAMLVPLS
jgi:hypothetical protein